MMGDVLEERLGYMLRNRSERAMPNAYVPPDSYLERFLKERKDPQKFIPAKSLVLFSKNQYPGLYGFTYRIDGKIHKESGLERHYRDLETDIHECIHTVSEYETRRLVESIMGIWFGNEKYRSKREYVR
jgi:hypothetical protein